MYVPFRVSTSEAPAAVFPQFSPKSALIYIYILSGNLFRKYFQDACFRFPKFWQFSYGYKMTKKERNEAPVGVQGVRDNWN